MQTIEALNALSDIQMYYPFDRINRIHMQNQSVKVILLKAERVMFLQSSHYALEIFFTDSCLGGFPSSVNPHRLNMGILQLNTVYAFIT